MHPDINLALPEREESGAAEMTVSRFDLDKCSSDNELEKEVGKDHLTQRTSLDAEDLPESRVREPQVSERPRDNGGVGGESSDAPPSRLRLLAHVHHVGTSTGTPTVNEFRTALDQFLTTDTGKGFKHSAIPARLDLLTRALFFEARTFSLTDLGATLAPRNSTGFSSYFLRAFQPLVDSCRILTYSALPSGSSRTPYAFDLRREQAFSTEPTWADLLSAFLDDADDSRAATAVTATREMLGLKPYTPRIEVCRVAASIGVRLFHGLPERFAEQHMKETPEERKTVQNLVSALRGVLLHGLRHDLFPLYFPEHRPYANWRAVADEAFPLLGESKRNSGLRKAREALLTLFGIARAELQVATAADLTEETVRAAWQMLLSPHRAGARSKISRLRTLAGKTPGNWKHPVVQVILAGLGRGCAPMAVERLRHATVPELPAQTLDGFISVVESHGLSASWREFFVWYQEYSTLDWRTMGSRAREFPARAATRKLGESTLTFRRSTARAFLACARRVLPDAWSSLTPTAVFSTHYSTLVYALMAEWEASVEAGGASHRSSEGLEHLIVDSGMIARALYDRSLHARGVALACSAEPLGGQRFVDAERFVAGRTDDEQALLAAHELAGVLCSNIREERRQSSHGSGDNTVKDLHRSIRETPFISFQRAQLTLLDKVQKLISSGSAQSPQCVRLTVAALVHGILVSGGVRRSEIAHLREDIQVHLANGSREVLLRAVDRKNMKPHHFVLRAKWLPEWFLSHYLKVVRPLLVAKAPDVRVAASGFLVLHPTSGLPYGCLEESRDGTGRNTIALERRKIWMSRLWVEIAAQVFVETGLFLPAGSQRFSMHIVRNVGAHAVFVQSGVEAAAHFLGDSISMVEGVYGALRGELVDTSLMP